MERYASDIDKVESSVKFNSKSFWSFVNSKRKRLDIPGTVYLKTVEAEEGEK